MTEVDPSLQCSFCTKSAKDVKKLIKGPEVYICDECIDLCHKILYSPAAKPEAVADPKSSTKPTPKSIKEHLDKYVIGQDEAKIAVAVAVYDHYKRLVQQDSDDNEVEIEKSNILLLGPTGCGKTLIAQSIARHLDVPFAIADATSLTEAGYVGDDVESILSRLLQSADGDIQKAERGIIYLDEIDKKARRSEQSASRDVSGEGVQQGLLKLLEGSDVMVPVNGKRGPNGDLVKVNTKNILFICGGAFVGLEKIVEQALTKEGSGIGFGAKGVGKKVDATLMRKIEPEHLQKFGLIPELVGRLPVIAPLIELTDEQLVQVLTEPRNAVTKQFEKMFKMDGVELSFEEDALRAIAKEAKTRKTGARGLRAVVEGALLKLKYELPDLRNEGVTRIVITEGVVTSGDKPSFDVTPIVAAI